MAESTLRVLSGASRGIVRAAARSRATSVARPDRKRDRQLPDGAQVGDRAKAVGRVPNGPGELPLMGQARSCCGSARVVFWVARRYSNGPGQVGSRSRAPRPLRTRAAPG